MDIHLDLIIDYRGNQVMQSHFQKLGLSKANYKFALEAKLTPDEFVSLQEINGFDPAVDHEAFLKWQNQYSAMSSYSMKRVFEYTGLHVKEMVDYIESAYYNQGIECEEALTLWRDYISLFNSYYERNVKGCLLYTSSDTNILPDASAGFSHEYKSYFREYP